jgi:Ca2+-dependent lipid-binding protein
MSATELKTIRVRIIGATGLKSMDTFGLSDPYAQIQHGHSKPQRSPAIRRTLNPTFVGSNFVLKVEEPEELTITIMDEGAVGEDHELGRAQLNLKEETGEERRWIPLDPEGSGRVHVWIQTERGGQSTDTSTTAGSEDTDAGDRLDEGLQYTAKDVVSFDSCLNYK